MIDADAAVGPLIGQMERALELRLSYLALLVALTIPDILAGLGAEGGRTSGSKYRAWVDENTAFDGAVLYTFRCSMLHQGSAIAQDGKSRTIFVEPNDDRIQIHNGIDWFSIELLVGGLARSSRAWLKAHGQSNRVQTNLRRYARRWPDGIPELGVDIPVIA